MRAGLGGSYFESSTGTNRASGLGFRYSATADESALLRTLMSTKLSSSSFGRWVSSNTAKATFWIWMPPSSTREPGSYLKSRRTNWNRSPGSRPVGAIPSNAKP